jgi:hypothetical protein
MRVLELGTGTADKDAHAQIWMAVLLIKQAPIRTGHFLGLAAYDANWHEGPSRDEHEVQANAGCLREHTDLQLVDMTVTLGRRNCILDSGV